jgi:hypothetical protein
MGIPEVGVITASHIVAAVGTGATFANGQTSPPAGISAEADLNGRLHAIKRKGTGPDDGIATIDENFLDCRLLAAEARL